MKIKQILLKNFATINEIQIDFKDDVTYLVGENGSGKTTCGLNAIWFILEGIARTGKKVLHADRFRFIGKYGKSAVGQITLYDEKEDIEIYLKRSMTKNGTVLNVAASDDRDLGPDFVDKIFNIFSINPEGFSELSSKDQATVLGVDTTDIDARKKVCYNQRRELGYDVKQTSRPLEECGKVEEVEGINIQELLDRKAQIDKVNEENRSLAQDQREELYRGAVAHNKVQSDLQRKRNMHKDNIEALNAKISLLSNEVEVAMTKIKSQELDLADLQKVQPWMDTDIPMPEVVDIDTTELAETINNAQEQNKKAIAWEEHKKLNNKHITAVALHNEKDQEYQTLEQERIKYLKSCNLPFANITIDDAGCLMVDGRPFNKTYFSKGEILRAGIKMAAATMPELKYIFVPDAQGIDEKNREALFAELTAAGFQVVAEMVGTEKKKGNNSILLRESRVVDSYKDQKSVL
jgi:predicted ATP-dependent endonuclease of OLD family